ncbi:alanine/ornithine racemase family PLP-dependent enzyme [Iamia sp. SCSIO 61187]|uniref:alanine/ornithine racemase family PLP-dependent enzyme n=1 Tax=Iamia sp. SCSIO 61187 TaxID=2722752 RepID=UPI001C6396C8|nr:alanine/ornithine racemase family PLP-dependent enzyme [Iamia sp. SCSIO 61187]QYG93921.1 alanine/ornithine racemase family PLP-dependent enzyme [Iamia sp. SCSIO 61187]
MAAPRVEVDLVAVDHNARTLVGRLAARGIGVTGVTKATLGWPPLARTLVDAGVRGLADSRPANLERLAAAGVESHRTLLRSPTPDEASRVVLAADASCNTEAVVVRALSGAAVAAGRVHGVVLMVELGDLREGLMPDDVEEAALLVRSLPGLHLRGIGTNLACQSGVTPDATNMAVLSGLADAVEVATGSSLEVVSGGGSSTLGWALGEAAVGRIDDLRLGEAILLGREPLQRRALEGLRTDAFVLVGVVIEAKVKPSAPWGAIGETAFGPARPALDRGLRRRAIVALGHQDTDPDGLVAPPGMTVLGASSDHLVIDPGDEVLAVGDEVAFGLGYGALVRALTSPFVACVPTAVATPA